MDPLLPVLGASMRPLIERLQHYAGTEETLLLSGPTGVGKTHLARFCHAHSARRDGPLESLHLQSVPEPLQLGELFGWRRGAFTGAARDLSGHVARAHGGTLFIDEIDKLSLQAQAGLLWLLDERRYRPLGENTRERTADVRVMVATNVALEQRVAQGIFREDLYYRIHVLPVAVPPLRERRDEIVDWALYLLARHHQRSSGHKRNASGLSQAAKERLVVLPWPGNLRQLDNTLRRAHALASMEAGRRDTGLDIELRHLETAVSFEPEKAEPLEQALENAAAAVVQALEHREIVHDGLELCGSAFRAVVLQAALKRYGSEPMALARLGMDHWRQSRNTRRLLKREAACLERFLAVFKPPR